VRRHAPKYPPAVIDELVDYVVTIAGGDGPAIPSVRLDRGDLPEGGTLYRLNCAACHAWSGDGGALLHREAPSVHPATPTQIGEAVRGGPGNMPRFGEAAFTSQQLDSVVRYVRYLDDPEDRGGSPLWHLGPLVEGAVAVFLGLGALVLAVRWIGTRT
jgi:ubiquinol-cytochrome c reductase cytochrome c subunit